MRCFLKELIAFSITFTGIYLLCVLFLGVVDSHGGRPSDIAQKFFQYRHRKGGFTAARFKEAKDVREVDVLALGSSHCYRGIDVRLFEAAGLRCFNLGSSAQTPLNTFYLLEDFEFDPRLVIIEVYWGSLSLTGLESSLDLVATTPPTLSLFLMSVMTPDVRLVNSFLIETVSESYRTAALSREDSLDTYVSGGFVETRHRYDPSQTHTELDGVPSSRQLAYLCRNIMKFKNDGVTVVLITAPVSPDAIPAAATYELGKSKIQAIAKATNVRFWDFNEPELFKKTGFLRSDFYDSHHLTNEGSRKLSSELVGRCAELLKKQEGGTFREKKGR